MQNVRQGKDGKGGKGGGGKGGNPPGGGGGKPARALLALALLASAGSAQAQGYDVLISLSGDDTLPTGAVRDQDIVLQAPGAVAHLAWPSETLSLLAGDKGTGKWQVFTDVDAVADLGGATADQGLYLSLGSDEAGFKDGNVIRCGPGGMAAWRTEAEFMTACGATDGNVDLDALQIDGDGTVLFSFADNEASSFLSGDGTGVIKDGDVLTWGPSTPLAGILYSETQVNAMVTLALESGSTIATTDTTALAREAGSDAVLFAVQSPTSDDASVFTTANGGGRVAGHAESDLGFTVGPEIDALAVAASRFPVATVSSLKVPVGGTLTIGLHDAAAGVPYFALVSLSAGPSSVPMPGWGGFVLSFDPLLAAAWAQSPALLIVPDVSGTGALASVIPPMAATDVVVQIVAPAAAGMARASNPVVIELAQ